MSDGIKGYETGNKAAPRLTKEELQKKEKDDKIKLHAAYFREVFGPEQLRSKAQKYVMAQMAHFGYYNRSLSESGCSEQEFYGREGMRGFFLWIKEWANRPLDQKPKKPVEVNKGKFDNTNEG